MKLGTSRNQKPRPTIKGLFTNAVEIKAGSLELFQATPQVSAIHMLALFLFLVLGFGLGVYVTATGLLVAILLGILSYGIALYLSDTGFLELVVRLILAIVIIQVGYFIALLVQLWFKKQPKS